MRLSMAYDYHEEDQAELLRANGLVKKAIDLSQQKNTQAAANLFVKAMEIYLSIAAYHKIVETVNELVAILQTESQILPIMEYLRQIINTLEKLAVPEILANVKLALANLAFKNRDYLTAANLYIEIADLFMQVEADEYRHPSGMFLLRAAECFEKIGRSERAEKAVLDAIRLFDSSNFEYRKHWAQLQTLIQKKKYNLAIDEIREIALFFRHLENQLENNSEDSVTFQKITHNVTARLLHMVSEYNLIKMICYSYLGDDQKVMEQAEKSVKDLTHAIEIIKDDLKEGDFSTADLHRLTFDVFLLQWFQEFAHYQVEDPIDLAIRGLPAEIIEIIRKMKFYEYTIRLLELNLEGAVYIFEDIPLSQILSPFREFLLKAGQKE